EIYPAVDFLVGQGHGPANPNQVRVYDRTGAATNVSFLAYLAGGYGANVGGGDINGAIYWELFTGPGPGAVFGPQVKAFDKAGPPISKVNFFAYGTLRYGVNVASSDVDGDGFGEIISGAG